MRFPKAHAGVTKIFIAQILVIVAAVIGLTGTILLFIPPTTVVGATVGLVSLILMVLAFILQLVGLYQGGYDEGNFRVAFYVVIVAIVLTTLGIILGRIPGMPSIVPSVLETVGDVSAVIVTLYTLFGIAVLAKKLGDERMATRGKKLGILVFILFAASTILGLIPTFVTAGENEPLKIFFAVIGIGAAVIELITYVLIFFYLGRATKMLRK